MEDTLRIFDKGPGPRKAITLRTRQQQALMGLIDDKNGAERVILEELTWAVLHGDAIEPIFQSVVNAITARAIVCEKLPLKPKGRPKDISNDIGWSVAYQYFALKDGGVSYEKSVAEVAAEFCKDERHIMRLVKENKSRIGVTPDARKKTRTWFDGMVKNHRSAESEGRETATDRLIRILEERDSFDPIEEIEKAIALALNQITDIKCPAFNASD